MTDTKTWTVTVKVHKTGEERHFTIQAKDYNEALFEASMWGHGISIERIAEATKGTI